MQGGFRSPQPFADASACLLLDGQGETYDVLEFIGENQLGAIVVGFTLVALAVVIWMWLWTRP